MSENGHSSDPSSDESPWADRRTGVLVVLGLHVVFLVATWGIGFVAPISQTDADELLSTWIRWMGALQGIYVFPACITAALAQRWQVMGGMLAAAAVTLLASGMGAMLG
ncbi:MAG: hypothetical protein KDA24_11890 [Deltaproteobacteria bacterium]|nr:hypothetical protein [Deltaproteobacteria bacterium]